MKKKLIKDCILAEFRGLESQGYSHSDEATWQHAKELVAENLIGWDLIEINKSNENFQKFERILTEYILKKC